MDSACKPAAELEQRNLDSAHRTCQTNGMRLRSTSGGDEWKMEGRAENIPVMVLKSENLGVPSNANDQ